MSISENIKSTVQLMLDTGEFEKIANYHRRVEQNAPMADYTLNVEESLKKIAVNGKQVKDLPIMLVIGDCRDVEILKDILMIMVGLDQEPQSRINKDIEHENLNDLIPDED